MNAKTDDELRKMFEDLHTKLIDAQMKLVYPASHQEKRETEAQIKAIEKQLKKVDDEIKRREFMASHIF